MRGQPTPGSATPWWRRCLTHDQYLQTTTFAGLDGLRAIAATLVVVFHFGGPRFSFLQGWVGVQMFFVLSGYLITTLALRELERTGRVDLRAFSLRRLFRIVPVYLVVLALVWLFSGWGGSELARLRAALPYYLTFCNEVAPASSYSQTWTLGIEQKYYLVWPLLAFVLVRGTRRRIAVAITGIALLLPLWDHRTLHSVHYVVLLLGSLLAIVLHHPRGFALLRPLLSVPGSIVVGVGYVAGHLQLTDLLHRLGEPRTIPLFGLAVCLLLPTALGPGPVRWLLSSRILGFVGQRSYALYLVQNLVHGVASGLLPAVVVRPSGHGALVTWLLAVLLADLLLRCVERPMILAGKRLIRWLRTERRAPGLAGPGGASEPEPSGAPVKVPVESRVGQA